MPSSIVGLISGGALLVSGGDVYSGSAQWYKAGGLQLKLAAGAPGIVYAGLPNLSGNYPSTISGGALASGLSGYLFTDGMELSPGDTYFIPKVRLFSGIETVRFAVPAASSGGRVFWEILGLLLAVGPVVAQGLGGLC